jgi:hypothetical protein
MELVEITCREEPDYDDTGALSNRWETLTWKGLKKLFSREYRERSSSHQQGRDVVQIHHVKCVIHTRSSQPATKETGKNNSWSELSASPMPRRSVSPNSCASSPHASPCSVCDSTIHRTNQCPAFLGYSINERRDWIRSHNRCFNCLGVHSSKDCTSKYTCGKCQKRHHTLIHTDEPVSPIMTLFTTNAHGSDPSYTGILPTAIGTVTNSQGNELDQARSFLDSGAERCFITASAVQRLGLKVHGRTQQFAVAGGRTTLSMGYTSFAFRNRMIPSSTFNIQATVLYQITCMIPGQPLEINSWPHIQRLSLADPTFHTSGNIDILLGTGFVDYIMSLDLQGLQVPISQNWDTCYKATLQLAPSAL